LYRVTRTGTLQAVYRARDGRAHGWRGQGAGAPVVLTLPLCATARQRIAATLEMRRVVSDVVRMSGCTIRGIEAPLGAGEVEGAPYKLDRFSAGTIWPRGVAGTAFHTVCLEWLATFHAAAWRRTGFRYSDLPGMGDAETKVLDPLPADVRRGWELCQASWREADNVAQTMVHGDFHRGNILFDNDRAVDLVVDWDLAVLSGLPVWDVMTLFCVDAFDRCGVWSRAYDQAAEACVRDRSRESSVQTYYGRLGLDRRDIWYAVLTFPVLQLRNKTFAGVDRREKVILDGLPEVLAKWVRVAREELGIA
jgi:hypothetical protein